MPRHRSPPTASAGGPTGRRWLVAACLASVLFIAWLVWGRGPDFVAEAKGLQRQVLAMDLSARDQRAVLLQLMRHVDKLDGRTQQQLKDEMREAWRAVQREDMDAYFAAAENSRQEALDRALDRLHVITELDAAFTPGGMRVRNPPAQGGGQRAGRPTRGGRDVAKAEQRQVVELYATAMEKRARERGIDFSPLRRRLLRG